MSNIIFFDVDGTIITEDNYIPESAIQAIRAAQAAGNLCVVNTGRPFMHLVPAVRDIGFSGFICSCGQHIIMHEKSVLHVGFTCEESRDIVDRIRACRLDAVFESEAGVWHLYEGEPEPEVRKSLEHFLRLGFKINQSIDTEDFCFDKFCVWVNEDSDKTAFLQYIEPLCEVIFRSGNLIELVKKGYSKQTGIRKLVELTGIPFEKCYAIGDSTNDLPMFECVRHSIAMGNGQEELKERAEYVTSSLLEDGVQKALEFYHLY